MIKLTLVTKFQAQHRSQPNILSMKFNNNTRTMSKIPSKIFSEALSSWQTDESFINSALKAAKSVQIVSFDIFDTALTRSFDSPTDLFSAMESLLIEKYGRAAKGFARAREDAESNARRRLWDKRRAQDIKLTDIYLDIQSLFPFSKEIFDLMEIEIKLESESLHAVPDILNLYNQLKNIGKLLIFTSDMYLPRDRLSSILNTNGYKDFNGLYVSSELDKTKATGDIWDHIQNINPGSNYKGKILHIGDDMLSDVEKPTQKNVITLHYSRAKSSRRTGGKLGPGLASTSKWFRLATLNERKHSITQTGAHDLELDAYNLGIRLGAPVVGGFLQWLVGRLARSKPDRIYFLARDGYMLHHLWQNTPIAKALKIDSHYIFISRAALNLPAGYLQSTSERLSEPLLEFLCSTTGRVTANIALERSGLGEISSLLEDAKHIFNDMNAPLHWDNDYPRLRALFERHSASIYEVLKSKYSNTVLYMKQEGLFDQGHFAIVDLGWHASMQASLQQILRSAGGNPKLYGYYYGLWPAAERNRFNAGHLESFLSSPQIPISRQPAIHWGVPYLEQFHGAPYGTTLGYSAGSNETILPVLQHSPAEVDRHNDIIRHFQRGVKDAILSATKLGITFDRASAIAAMGSVFLSPLDSELELLSSISHCATFDHLSQNAIISPSIPKDAADFNRRINESESPLLQLRLWQKNASEIQYAQIRDKALDIINSIDHRTFRQFQ